jgi:hypothetical protein
MPTSFQPSFVAVGKSNASAPPEESAPIKAKVICEYRKNDWLFTCNPKLNWYVTQIWEALQAQQSP